MNSDDIKSHIYQEERPWGKFRQFASNEVCTVKIITVNPRQTLSKQLHQKRDELWVILDHGLKVELDDNVSFPHPGDEFVITRGTKHRLSSIGPQARILEVSFGYFDENDIQRFEDIYGRK
jgi:mannose-1-phosphate guanylyltransferase/mannose-6-phosphate isomerase